MPQVIFNPGRRRMEVPDGEALVSAAARAGLPLRAPCGGRGSCGKCRVTIRPAPEPTPAEREFLAGGELDRGVRLACQVRVRSDLEVDIPEGALLYDERILVDSAAGHMPAAPAISAVEFELPEPALSDPADDLRRLSNAIGGGPMTAALGALRRLPGELRANSFRGLAVLKGRRLMDVLAPGAHDRLLGAAFDLGTTTFAGSLVSLVTGEILATSSRANPQGPLGDDVITRTDHARQGPAELEDLRRRAAGGFDDMLGEMLAEVGRSRDEVYRATVAGNTVMTHLFLGVSPENIAVSPFAPAATCAVELPAADAGLDASPAAEVLTLPCVAGYVGGDIVAGLLAAAVHERRGVTLYIDIGTNGEVVLAREGDIYACSVAAGPAFEGARISQGMRAAAGAIDSVRLAGGDLSCTTIAGAPAKGICGTGLIDAAAVLLETGLLDPYGLMVQPGAAPEGLPDSIASRIVEHDGQTAFRLDGAVCLTQRDIRELQLAKGAVAAGVEMLLQELALSAADIDGVLLAGGFGTFVDRRNVLKVGLLPAGIDGGRVDFVGNAAAAGARMVLVSESHERRAAEIARAVNYVELSGRPEFQMKFADAMLFPAPAGT